MIIKSVLLFILPLFILIPVIFGIVCDIRNNMTYRNQMIILNAIYLYKEDCIRNGQPLYDCMVDYSDMEDYNQTYNSWFDWGYTKILPSDKYILVEPYIEEAIAIYERR